MVPFRFPHHYFALFIIITIVVQNKFTKSASHNNHSHKLLNQKNTFDFLHNRQLAHFMHFKKLVQSFFIYFIQAMTQLKLIGCHFWNQVVIRRGVASSFTLAGVVKMLFLSQHFAMIAVQLEQHHRIFCLVSPSCVWLFTINRTVMLIGSYGDDDVEAGKEFHSLYTFGPRYRFPYV